jgi:hypothetical protein
VPAATDSKKHEVMHADGRRRADPLSEVSLDAGSRGSAGLEHHHGPYREQQGDYHLLKCGNRFGPGAKQLVDWG